MKKHTCFQEAARLENLKKMKNKIKKEITYLRRVKYSTLDRHTAATKSESKLIPGHQGQI